MNEKTKSNLKPWVKGQSGNPAGRPVGSRQKIAEYIIRDIASDWQVNGARALAELAKTDVAAYCKLAAGLIPKEFNLSVATATPGGLSSEEWSILNSIIGAVKVALPNAGTQNPSVVLEYVRDALAAHSAPMIELAQPGVIEPSENE